MILERLRAATAPSHRDLEADLGLLDPPLDADRFRRLLARFHGYHRVWEPLMARLTGDAAFMAERSRLRLLEQDLEALGGSAGPDAPLPILMDAGQAWGSIYVLEGSTLGGKVIAKALQTAPWRPARGLTYFDPYGRDTATMWRIFLERLEIEACSHGPQAVIDGALATFENLRGWLAPRRAAA